MGLAAIVLGFVLTDVVLRVRDPTMRQFWAASRRDHVHLREVLRFEERGGRVQDLSVFMASLRRTVRQYWIGRAPKYLFVVALCFWLRDRPLLAATVVGVLVLLSSFIELVISESVGLSSGGERKAGESKWIGLQLISRAVLACCAVWLLLIGAVAVDQGANLSGMASIALGVLVTHVAHVPARWIELTLWRKRPPEFSEDTQSDAVLYLRSFASDSARMYSGFRVGGIAAPLVEGDVYLEELLGLLTVASKGQLVAIGRPGTSGQQLGAAKSYWADEHWQQAVIKTTARVQTVIVTAGLTHGLSWEIGMLKNLNQLSKLLVVFPPGSDAETRQAYQRLLADAGEPELRTVLPLTLVPSLVGVAFDESLNPIHYLAPGRNWRTYLSAGTHFLARQQGLVAYDPQGLITQTWEGILNSGGNEAPDESQTMLQKDRYSARQRLYFSTRYMQIEENGPPDVAEGQYADLSREARAQGLPGLALVSDTSRLSVLRESGRDEEAEVLARHIIREAADVGTFKPPWLSKEWVSGSELALFAYDDLLDHATAAETATQRRLMKDQQALARRAKRDDTLAEALLRQAHLEASAGQAEQASKLLEESTKLFRAQGNFLGEARGHRLWTRVSRGEDARYHGAEAIRLARLHGDRNLLSLALEEQALRLKETTL